MDFNNNLKLLLKGRNLKQAELCRMTGIQTSLMSDYLGSKKSPTIGNAILIADALNISLDALVGKDTYSAPEDQQGSKILSELYDVANELTAEKAEILKRIQKMSDSEVHVLLAFVNTLDNLNKEKGE